MFSRGMSLAVDPGHFRDGAAQRPTGCNSQLLRVNVCNPADLLQPLLQASAVNKDQSLPSPS